MQSLDLLIQTSSRLLWHTFRYTAFTCSHIYTPLFIARYSFIQLSELNQSGVNYTSMQHHYNRQMPLNPTMHSMHSQKTSTNDGDNATLVRQRLTPSPTDMETKLSPAGMFV